MRFGNPTVGSPFQPPLFDHDSSFKAADTLIPRTSVISAGGNVTFDIAGFHQAMIYEPGTTLDDIDVPPFPPESNILINECDGLLDSSPVPFPPPALQGPVDAGRRHVRRAGAVSRPLQRHPARRVREDVRLGERQEVDYPMPGASCEAPPAGSDARQPDSRS